MLLRCKQHDETLVLVSRTKGERLAVCPVCGAGWNAKEVIEDSAGLVAGLLSEEELVGFREQIRIGQEKGFEHLETFRGPDRDPFTGEKTS
jgi:hypothetical protein